MSLPDASIVQMDGGVVSQVYGDQISANYDPQTEQFSISFASHTYLQFANSIVKSSLQIPYTLDRINIQSPITTCFANAGDTDPVTGADLTKISEAGVAILFKRAFDSEYNNQFYQRQLAHLTAVAKSTPTAPNPNGTTAMFTANVSGLEVAFTSTNTTTAPITVVSTAWIFGDGVGSLVATNPTYTYAANGTYTVTEIVTDSTGANTLYSDTITV